MKSEGATEVTPSIETVARCDSASSLALAGYLSFGLSANLALSERYACAAVNGKQGAHGYPQGRLTCLYLKIRDAIDLVQHVDRHVAKMLAGAHKLNEHARSWVEEVAAIDDSESQTAKAA